jgi:transcriptional regulator with XRE-family HTH domain
VLRHLPDNDDWLYEERRAIGDRIRTARLGQDLTQERVYLAAGISRAALQAIEGGTRDPRLSTLQRIARVLGVHVADLTR